MSDLLVIRTVKNQSYKTIKLDCTEDPELSWKAKGIHTYLISRPDGWKVWRNDLLNRARDGREALGNGIKELTQAHYLYVFDIKDSQGRFCGAGYLTLESAEPDLVKIRGYLSKMNTETHSNVLRLRGEPAERETRIAGNPPLSKSKDIYQKEVFDSKGLKTLSASGEAPLVDMDEPSLRKRTKPNTPLAVPAAPAERSEYLEHWNAQDNTSKHANPATKVYQEADRRCGQLEHGILGRACEIDARWMEKNKVDAGMLRRKWTPDEIREGIRRLALIHKEGYWPPDKTRVPRSLSDMIYNPRSKSSWFLKVMAEEPKPIADTVKPLDDSVLATYRKKLFKGKALTDGEENTLINKVNLLIGKQREIEKHLAPYLHHTSFSGKFGARRFYETHIDWLLSWCQDIRVETVWGTWGAFVRWARDFHQMEIEPSDDNVRHAKQAHRRVEEQRKRNEESAERNRIGALAGLV
jgi:hypothetical protein